MSAASLGSAAAICGTSQGVANRRTSTNPTGKGRAPAFRLAPRLLAFFVAGLFLVTAAPFAAAAPAKANLDQCGNGALASPDDPCNWINGNLNPTKSHYYEGESVAYRAVLTNLATTGTHTLEIGYDIRNGGKNAIDYLTSYDRIDEVVDPCDGLNSFAACPTLTPGFVAVPTPTNNMMVAGYPQPLTSFQALPSGEQYMTIIGGTFTGAAYVSPQGSLTAPQSETRLTFTFTASSSTVVIAWGGHIASSADWGAGNSAVGIDGSPYHMRIKALDGTPDSNGPDGGNQDRSMQEALAIPVEPQGASLTIVKKVVNQPAGGTNASADFMIHVLDANGDDLVTDALSSPQPGDAFGTSYSAVPAGDYTVTEDPAAADLGYELTFEGDCAPDGAMTLVDGQIAQCILLNTAQQSHLTVIKEFDNGDGGAATLEDVDLLIDGEEVQSGIAMNVTPGWHTVSELGPAGYNGTITGACDPDTGMVDVALGEDLVCTITNDDVAPRLKIVKTVLNDDLGPANVDSWQYFVNSTAPGSTRVEVFNGSLVAFMAGTYNITEEGLAGYTASFSGDCALVAPGVAQVVLEVGHDYECNILNDDIAPRLTVVKEVKDDDGGSLDPLAVPLFIDGEPAINGTPYTLTVGMHQVSETPVDGWAASIAAPCGEDGMVYLGPGEDKTCIITNDDIRPLLTVVKIVENDNGGWMLVKDAELFVDGQPVGSGQQLGYDVGVHQVSETPVFGYTANFTEDCDETGLVSLMPGNVSTCVITNDDIQPLLTVTKTVKNDNGGTLDVVDFHYFVDGVEVTSGEENGFDADEYLVSETGDGLDGYEASFGGDCDLEGLVTLAIGLAYECTILNDDIQPRLNVTKLVINDDGGLADVGSFALFVGNETDFTSVQSGQPMGFDAGKYHVNETGRFGYAAHFEGDCDEDGNLTLEIGKTYECILVNDDIAPILTVVKNVTNDDGGTMGVADFPLDVGNATANVTVASGVAHELRAGLYRISEDGDPGYAASFEGDCGIDGAIALSVGENRTCYIVNDDIAPRLTVIKIVENDNGGTLGVDDFRLDVGNATANATVPSGVAMEFMVGAYRVSEDAVPGYIGNFTDGDCAEDGAIVLALADERTCTLTNRDQPAHLWVVKDLVNDDGGVAIESNFHFHVEADGATPADFDGMAAPGVEVLMNASHFLVTEEPAFGYTATYAGCEGDLGLGEVATCIVTNDDIDLGRMTGGGSLKGTSVRHGFELHCNPADDPNRLEVNWKGTDKKEHKFHLERLTLAACTDDPSIRPKQPVALFDTYVGQGVGRYDGVSGATIEFTFTDAGEPGKLDKATVVIKVGTTTVLTKSANLDSGNQQAHR